LSAFAIIVHAQSDVRTTPISAPPGPTPFAGADTSVRSNPLRNAYFGDLHVHTSYSFDAYIMGTRTTPDDAYRFARGQPVDYKGGRFKLGRPLDFMAVTDHAENMGVAQEVAVPGSVFARSEPGRRILWAYSLGRKEGDKVFWDVEFEKDYFKYDPVQTSSAWQHEINAANSNYIPGKFTTFIGYEWSTMVDVVFHYHRNVIFSGDRAPLPFSAIDSKRPEDLWSYLEANRKRGIEALAIPHSPDFSNGLMYDWVDSRGKLIDKEYALRRMRNEPLSEIMQIKGQSETQPALSPNDEFAGFEVLSPGKIHGSYIREAYGRGLIIGVRTGANPYRFGVVGGSDLHSGLSDSEPGPYGYMQQLLTDGPPPAVLSTSGLTGVWAENNTRPSIYAALRRKETFATSGSRLTLRFFGGWRFNRSLLRSRDWVRSAYRGGVPMGSDLPSPGAFSRSPSFMVWAAKDPDGANLDRVQIIKIWLRNGTSHEKVFDVALSKGREVGRGGKFQSVGNTVDLKRGTYTNTIGATELKALWQDPQFDPSEAAVYYMRVMEIPTPRWSTLWAIRNGKPPPANVPAAEQQRGWSSPIWYSPGAGALG
jgi:hypothetical protein